MMPINRNSLVQNWGGGQISNNVGKGSEISFARFYIWDVFFDISDIFGYQTLPNTIKREIA